jgi:hypothetical protein
VFMDKAKTNTVDRARRGFLRAAGGAGALGALAAAGQATAKPAVAPEPAAAPAQARPVGYHETEHIRQYYRTARYW